MRWCKVLVLLLCGAGRAAAQSDEPILGKPATWSAETVLPSSDASTERLEPSAEQPAQLDPCAIDAERLARSRAQLSREATARAFGRHELYTDVDDERLLAHLESLARNVDEAWSQSLGVPLAEPSCKSAIVLIADEQSHAVLTEQETQLPQETRFLGHAGAGVATLFVGKRTSEEVGSTLIHELTHLLNSRVLGPRLPPALDEGLALYLGTARVARKGEIDPDDVEWKLVPLGGEFRGPADFISRLSQAYREGETPPLSELLGFSRADFLGAQNLRLLSVYSLLWVRFLLDPKDEQLAHAFRQVLAAHAEGTPPPAATLDQHLGRSWEALESGFHRWLEQMRHRRELGVG